MLRALEKSSTCIMRKVNQAGYSRTWAQVFEITDIVLYLRGKQHVLDMHTGALSSKYSGMIEGKKSFVLTTSGLHARKTSETGGRVGQSSLLL
jgi:hypothetical protein